MSQRLTLNQEDGTISFQKLFNQFILYQESNNSSKDTLIYYERCYNSFGKFFDVDNMCNMVNEDLITNYKLYLKKERNVKDVTINTELRGLRAIIYFGMERDYIKKFKVKIPKVVTEVKEVYTDKELNILLKKPDLKKSSFAVYRNWVVTNFLLSTGCRLETIINIKIGDINLHENELLLEKTKNKKQYTIPISKQLAKVLTEYLKYRKGGNNDYLFSTIYGKKIAKRTLQDQISKYNRSRGVEKTSMHVYRNTFAKKYILNGGNLFMLQKLLGHRTLEMVKRYVEMYTEDLKKDFNNLNPLDNFISEYSNGERIRMSK